MKDGFALAADDGSNTPHPDIFGLVETRQKDASELINTVNAPSKDAHLHLGYPFVFASAARPLPLSLPKKPNFGLQGSCVLTTRP